MSLMAPLQEEAIRAASCCSRLDLQPCSARLLSERRAVLGLAVRLASIHAEAEESALVRTDDLRHIERERRRGVVQISLECGDEGSSLVVRGGFLQRVGLVPP